MGNPVPIESIPRRQILIIGMLDSVHLARWLGQFVNEEIDFVIFASKKYRKLHSLTFSLLNSNYVANYKLAHWPFLPFISGYLDFLSFELRGYFKFLPNRAKFVEKILKRRTFQYIHAFEIQGAGYLINKINADLVSKQKIILTNWGSDIYYFAQFPLHEKEIRGALAKASYYSGECVRDYLLARQYGFAGEELPCIPNAGGFQIEPRESSYLLPSSRNQILIKGYGGTFGRADLPIALIPRIANKYPQIRFHIYSATDDTLKLLETLPEGIKDKISISTVQEKLTHNQMLMEFAKSRIYIGCSVSDGISTSFIEALIYGAYPIQTNTSCANEWVSKGVEASIVGLDPNLLLVEILKALEDNSLVDSASENNYQVALKHLSNEIVEKQALKFYKPKDLFSDSSRISL